ncbi:MAG: sodium-dependent transporter [Planctomycetes bacterium]|nr:sodium-dependent transporter [Planctomycetota bacterium]
MSEFPEQRERWGTRIGLILAAAGNAVGIGNLLRFPSQAGQHGGGAFIIPYIVSLLVFGIPMMWLAWWVGRYGGRYGHGTTPGMFERITNSNWGKYVGVLGLAVPLVFCWYYTYIESWMLGYSWFSLTGGYKEVVDFEIYLNEYLINTPTSNYLDGLSINVIFVVITILLNVFILYRGISKGIETLAKIAMPLLFLFCLILAVRVLTLESGKGSALDGLAYIWNPSFDNILTPGIWLAAAGQIFFTLSIGFGALECYASYLKEDDDVVLNGLTTASTNEFVEIIFGSLIAIPATAIFFGAGEVNRIASGGAFNIGMVAMPQVLLSLNPSELFGTIWFLLLFFAAFTSSVAVAQPVMAFFQDELKFKKGTSAFLLSLLWLPPMLFVMLFNKYGVLDQLDFFAGTLFLVIFSVIEVLLVFICFGGKRFWEDIHKGADIRIPRIFYYILKYVTPVALIAIFVGWAYTQGPSQLQINPKIQESLANYPKLVPDRSWKLEIKKDDSKHVENELISLCDRASEDIKVTALVDLKSKGISIKESSNKDADKLVESLLAKRSFVLIPPTGTQLSGSEKAEVIVEVLYTSEYIWIARIMMIAVLVIFLALIKIAWSKRKKGAA